MAIQNENSISIVIQYHPIKRQLYRAINSFLAQSFKPIEMIVVNDGCERKINLTQIHADDVAIKIKSLAVNYFLHRAFSRVYQSHFIRFLFLICNLLKVPRATFCVR